MGKQDYYFSYTVVIIICSFSFESSIHGFSTFSVLITLYSFESYMEWKYDRESKEFLISLGGTISLMITGIILYFLI